MAAAGPWSSRIWGSTWRCAVRGLGRRSTEPLRRRIRERPSGRRGVRVRERRYPSCGLAGLVASGAVAHGPFAAGNGGWGPRAAATIGQPIPSCASTLGRPRLRTLTTITTRGVIVAECSASGFANPIMTTRGREGAAGAIPATDVASPPTSISAGASRFACGCATAYFFPLDRRELRHGVAIGGLQQPMPGRADRGLLSERLRSHRGCDFREGAALHGAAGVAALPARRPTTRAPVIATWSPMRRSATRRCSAATRS